MTQSCLKKTSGLQFFELAEKLYPDNADAVEQDEFARHINLVSLAFDSPCPKLTILTGSPQPHRLLPRTRI